MFNEKYSEIVNRFTGFDRTMLHRFALGVLSEGLSEQKAEEALDVIKIFADSLLSRRETGGGNNAINQ